MIERAVSDGFRNNAYLGRDDTNGRDETTARLRLRAGEAGSGRADLSLLYADFDNRYDAFAIDNSFETLSDRPGRDAQRSAGASFDLAWPLAGGGEWRSITGAADSDIVASFDGDWGNERDWGAAGPYDYFSETRRTRRQPMLGKNASRSMPTTNAWPAWPRALLTTPGPRQKPWHCSSTGNRLRTLSSIQRCTRPIMCSGACRMRGPIT